MRIAVVGDVLLDRDVSGSADRLSPDAPVPVVSVQEIRARAGGAGLVATLLARDGIDVVLVTALGEDPRAAELRELLSGRDRVGTVEVIASRSALPTPVKTRVRGAGHPLLRVDEACDPVSLPPVATDEQLRALEEAEAVVVADYGRGVTADPRLREALQRAGRRVPIVWDPHPKGAPPVGSIAVATPNASEAAAAGASVDGGGGDVAEAAEAARRLAGAWAVPAILLTLGERGALLHEPRGTDAHVIAPAEVASGDTCGAGDRLAATLAVELARGSALASAAEAAVAAAGRFVAQGGVDTLDAPAPAPLGGDADALTLARRVRAQGGTVVATGGCFDLLHAGHARTLAAARRLGDCLVVCLNSDASVRRLKGAERPIIPESDRHELLLALECVDAVMVFDEDTPEAVLARLRPDLWVKGGDYTPAALPETALLQTWGGRTVTVPYHPARSTTHLAGALARVG
ncbi:PfkB family carbohydrate kinase [Microbacterium sp. BK668]|uniref:PfkB family carbohydrate kinase n=1 Tax=Microbacterium sp. BK668 TaxID=2512118 RepID=UPI001061C074|nr:PfkB family carbohydrate kinase [Microbacterium sp. BK668]TDN90692.1 rfaE bifunctional protein kinase chain/domain/rfaE bifunctional protein nucleotidyltransferase chain/domain [Microbacterium sp. BK668]